MPQLNPTPWLSTMLISWLIFSLILQPKLSSFISTNQPTDKTLTSTTTSPWNWPWA